MEETLHNEEFVAAKLEIIKTIKNIYSQIDNNIDSVARDINSEKLTENLTTSIEFLKEIKEHQKDKHTKKMIYN